MTTIAFAPFPEVQSILKLDGWPDTGLRMTSCDCCVGCARAKNDDTMSPESIKRKRMCLVLESLLIDVRGVPFVRGKNVSVNHWLCDCLFFISGRIDIQ